MNGVIILLFAMRPPQTANAEVEQRKAFTRTVDNFLTVCQHIYLQLNIVVDKTGQIQAVTVSRETLKRSKFLGGGFTGNIFEAKFWLAPTQIFVESVKIYTSCMTLYSQKKYE